ncbi:hypothetical protein EML15_06330 [Corynebacterium sp. sy017]|uniref:DUF7507 domain-containing protein n=1 Tax=unclassified Corynebacterium TaxID=2624378 RepID=UPI001184D555|nr:MULTISPECIES: hypothetical protein [unclassified Corynebacterium]MBP3088766.1 hypothetical protein [Corynebacterium sp. sy017]TSD92047.1 hypothetical protein ELY17_06330 [Corynebacterium sp. SY003]
MGKKHWLLRRVGAVIMTTGLLSSGMWGGASSGVGVPVVWAADETTAPAADTASPKKLPGKPGEPGSAIKSLTVTADPDEKDKVVLTVDFAFPDDAKPGDYVEFGVGMNGTSSTKDAFPLIYGDIELKDPNTGKNIAVISGGGDNYRVMLQPEAEGLVNRTAQFIETEYTPQSECNRAPASMQYTATTTDSHGNTHKWGLFTTEERDGGKCNQNVNPIPRGVIGGVPIPRMACSISSNVLKYLAGTNKDATQGAGLYGSATGYVYVTPPIGDVGGANETFQDIYVRVRVDDAQTPMKMTELSELLKVKTAEGGFVARGGGWKPGDLDTKYPEGTPVPPQAYVYPPDFDVAGVKAKAQPGTNGLSESFDWNSKTITQQDATALGKLFADAYTAWQEAHKPEVIGSNDDPANGTVHVDYKVPGLYKPVIMQNAWGEPVASLKSDEETTDLDENGNASANAVADALSKSALYSIGGLGSGVFAPYSGAAKYGAILTYSTDPVSYKEGAHVGGGAHYGSCGTGDSMRGIMREGIAAGDPLQAKPVPRVSVSKRVNGEGANEAPGIAVAEGKELEFSFIIRNTGNTVLKNLRLADDKIPADKITCGSNSLDTVVLQPDKTVLCSATLPALKPGEQHTNLATVTATPVDKDGNPVDGGDVSSQDPANAHGAAPGVELVKKINAVDANTAQDAVVVDADSDMSVMFEVTNTGDMPLKDIVVSDDVITDPSKITCPGRPEKLNPGAKLICYATLPAPQAGEMHTNTGMVTATPVDEDGNPVGDTPLTDSDPANARVPKPRVPGVKVVKLINGDDANREPGVAVKPGESLNISFEVSNTGETPLKDVTVSDDKIKNAQDIVCANKPEVLAPGESFTCTAVLPAPSSGVTHKDTATVTGVPVDEEGHPVGDTPVRDDDSAFAWLDEPSKVEKLPSIKVIKKIDGDDANVAPGVRVAPGSDMNISFEVTNDGSAALENINLTDNVIPAKDITCEGKPESLKPGQSFTCQATLKAPVSGDHVNIATVEGTPVYGEGEFGPTSPVSDVDPARAWVDEPVSARKVPSVKVMKSINGDDANAYPGVGVAPGSDMNISFEVSNDGDVPLENVTLTDNVIPAKDITCADKPESLKPGESFTCSASLKAPVSGKHVNIAAVEGTPVYADGESGPTSPVLDVDPARAWVDEPASVVKTPAISVIKKINGDDANVYPGVKVGPGSDMDISFEVTNTGSATLGTITLSDNVIPADQITCDNKPESLKPGESFTCSATLKAPATGDHVNIATVEGTPVYGEGESGPTSPVSDDDPARAWVDEPQKEVKKPSITVVKKINDEDANTKPGVKVQPGSDMDVVFEVTNTGSATLENIALSDNVIPADQITCENKPETLAPGQSFTCSATLKAPASGDHVNIASVEGTPVYGDGETGPDGSVKDSDEANAWVDEPQKEVKKPSIHVMKKINDDDANSKPGVKVQPGSDMDIVFEVTNTGTATLGDITVSDNVIPADQITCENKPETLKPGQSFTCHATLTAPSTGDHVNIATVEGTPVYGDGETGSDQPVKDVDEANAWVDVPDATVMNPSITVVKKINDDDANTKPGVGVKPGSDMDIVFEVSNDGDVALGDVALSDNVIPAKDIMCEDKPDTLNPGESFTCTATLKAPATGDHVNIATVEGTPVYGEGESGPEGPVKDSDVARAWVDEPEKVVKVPSITVIKKINGDDANAKPGVKVQPGSDMDIVFEVTNTGSAVLESIDLSDNVIPSDQITCEDKPEVLKPGESFTCHATLTAPASGDHVNIATAQATPVYGDGETGSDQSVSDVDVARAVVVEPDQPEQPEQPEEGKPAKPAKPAESEADKPAKSESSKPAGSCGESVGVKPVCDTPSEPESSKPAEPGQSGGVIAGEVVKHCQKPTNPTNPAQSGINPAESGEPVKAEPAADKTAKTTAKAGAKTNTGGKTQKSGVRVTTGGHLAA